MNATQTALKIREQIDGFMGIVFPHFSKPACKFLHQMVCGIQSARDTKLSEFARALNESVSLKKTEERLSRNIQVEGLDVKLNRIMAGEGAKRIKKDTLIIVDPTDIRKEYARKMPHLATIHDGSSGELATGYSGCMAVACEPRSRQMIPLHLRMGSSEVPDFVSENHQVLEVMRTIHQRSHRAGAASCNIGRTHHPCIQTVLRYNGVLLLRAGRWCGCLAFTYPRRQIRRKGHRKACSRNLSEPFPVRHQSASKNGEWPHFSACFQWVESLSLSCAWHRLC